MVIDFHTHIFPKKIASHTIEALEERSQIKAAAGGTLEELRISMKEHHIDYSVVLPVATKPSQFDSINSYAASINNTEGILSFGGIHPENDNISNRLAYIKSLGLKGIKLHPDYQNTYIDDERYIEIIKECIRLNLCCVIHAGYDVGLPIPIHCPPDRACLMLQQVLKDCDKDSKIVLAHVGGNLQWQLVEKLLVWKNVYFDLAFCRNMIEKEQLMRIIRNHGSHRILYATDFPWDNQKETVDYIKALPLSGEELDNILYKNALRLLDMH